MVARAASHFGRLDIAVANAVYCDRELFYEAKIEGVRRTVDVTMWGAFHTLRAAAQQMITRNVPGSIVLIGSPHAWIATPKCIAYNMSKAAVVQMARTAALELAPQRIRVNIIHPGWTDTPGERKYATEEQLAEGGAQLPFGRLGRPDEIARGVVFLCDPASEYITGSELSINGGSTLPWWDQRGEKPADAASR
jgi:glucose 1-dehydrogenase